MASKQELAIHTVYKPQENLYYLKDWLEYHSALGFKKFFMYDNGESFTNGHRPPDREIPLKNKYGYAYEISLREARNKQKEIFKDFNVELIHWSPIGQEGLITYGQAEAIKNYLNTSPVKLTAFIDIDEYIIKREPFGPSRLLQKKYHHLQEYSSVQEISRCIPNLNTRKWGSKVMLDPQELSSKDIDSIANIHMENFDLPISKNYFNHYNYNQIQQDFLAENVNDIDPSFKMEDYPDILKEELKPNDVRLFFNSLKQH